VNLQPARVAAGSGLFEQTVPFGSGSAIVQVDPAEAGDNAVHVYLLEATGAQLDLVETPTFSFSLPAQEVGPIERTPYRAGPGHYTIDGPEMSIPGTWLIEIRGLVSQFEEATATVQVPIR
jgi:copper transport protein